MNLPLRSDRSPRNRVLAGCLLAGLLAGAGATPVAGATQAASDTVPGAPWVRVAQAINLPDLKQGISRPEVLLYSDSYVYGANSTFGSDPNIGLTVAPNGFDTAVTAYLYWVNRDSDQVRYYNLSQGWVTQEVDLFGQSGDAVRVLVPEVADLPLFGEGGALGPLSGVPSTTGRYMLVFELRDPNGDEPLARDSALYNFVDNLVTVSGNLAGNNTWNNENAYYMDGPVRVPDGGVLTIEKGTVILGGQANQGLLNVRQGGRINAVGEPDDPIVFTSEFERDGRAVGDWGGLVINGRAPVNNAEGGALPLGEGDSGTYGGNVANDNSGSLEYLRIEFAGIRFTDENELNGLALQGVGTGTVVRNIQILGGSDDGIEMFGGTVDIEKILVTNVEDDAMDWTFGWNGDATDICLLQTTAGTDRDKLVEADGNEQNNSAEPRSNPTIRNFLAWGRKLYNDPGLQFRRGTWLTMTNAAIGGTTLQAIVVDGTESQQAVTDGNIVFQDVIVQNVGGISNIPLAGVTEGNPRIANPVSAIHPDLAPLQGDNSCTTRANDWTQEPWVNWDFGPTA